VIVTFKIIYVSGHL